MNTMINREPARILVLNAIADVVLPIEPPVLADQESRRIIRHAYEDAISSAEKRQIEEHLHELSELKQGTHGDSGEIITQVADDVLSELSSQCVCASVEHNATFTLPRRQTAIYTFSQRRDPALVKQLSLSPSSREPAMAGAEAVANREYDRAVAQFERAIDESKGGGGMVSTRILAGWAHLWNGEPNIALDLIEEVAQIDSSAWDARVLWISTQKALADDESTLQGKAFFRWLGAVPDGGSVEISIDSSVESDPIVWSRTSDDEIVPLDSLSTEVPIKVNLKGALPAFPELNAYYLALGVVDTDVRQTTHVEQVLFTGPETADPDETIRFSV